MEEAIVSSVSGIRNSTGNEKDLQFCWPRRRTQGVEGTPIALRTNFFAVEVQNQTFDQYQLNIFPEVFSKSRCREILRNMVSAYSKYFENIVHVYDGKDNIYTQEMFPFGKKRMEFDVAISKDSKIKQKFSVFCQWKSRISLSKKSSLEAIETVDAIFRYLPSFNFLRIGHLFLSRSMEPNGNLREGNEVWSEYHQSLCPTQLGLMVNIDVTANCFHCSMTVTEFLAEILDLPVQSLEERRSISDSQRIKFAKKICGLKIEVNHCGQMRRRYRVCRVSHRPAQTQTFQMQLDNGKIIDRTVANFFYEKYNIQLKYPHLPCLQVGQERRNTYLPLEVCEILPGQQCNKKPTEVRRFNCVKTTSINALEREREISKLMSNDDFTADPYAKKFGITINSSMTEIKGRVLSAPKLLYGEPTRTTVIPHQGKWDMFGKQFHTGIPIRLWAIACFAYREHVQENHLRVFYYQLRNMANKVGMPITEFPCFCKYVAGVEQVESLLSHLKNNFPGMQMVLVVLPGATPIYAELKRVGDTVVGITTQCIQAKNVIRNNYLTLANFCMKMNAKLGGVNNIILPCVRPKIYNEPVIFIGCDISHPIGDSYKPSIAAVVGSMDAHPSRYAATVRAQERGQMIISDLASMVRELLIHFHRNTCFKPARIVVYRNGVSDGQLFKVLQYEIRAIREACMMIEKEYQPGITFIAVQKRHHARFFASDETAQVGEAKNIPPGSTVDSGITHPTDFDFYLCSHTGIRGTSRPSRYHVLWDDNKLSADDLQQLTYQLCHTYVNCTCSVSLPAPIFYAQLVASRARHHLVNSEKTSEIDSQKSSMPSSTLLNMTKAVQVHPDIETSMHFA